MEITVRFEGIQECIDAIEKIKFDLIDATERATEEVGKVLQRTARANFVGQHPPGFPHVGGDKPNVATGQLQGSITTLPVVAEGLARFSVTVGPTTIYARVIELGGTITPQEATYLSWFSPWLGRRVYRKEVTLTGWPYFRPAYETTVAGMNHVYEQYWKEAFHG